MRGQPSDYARRCAENIAKNKELFNQLFPSMEDLLLKRGLKPDLTKKGMPKGSVVSEQRESQSEEPENRLVSLFFVLIFNFRIKSLFSPFLPINTASGSPIEKGEPMEKSESNSKDTTMDIDTSLSIPADVDPPKDLETAKLSPPQGAMVIDHEMTSVDSTQDERLRITAASDSRDLAEASLTPITEETPLAVDDNGLLTWLGPMISYLRRVSVERPWQDLVTEILVSWLQLGASITNSDYWFCSQAVFFNLFFEKKKI